MSNSEAKAGELTYIAIVANFTDKPVTLVNLENGNDETTERMLMRRQFKMAVPWCQSSGDFATRKIVFKTDNKEVFWLWESNGSLYCSRKNDFSTGEKITGDNAGDGHWKALAFQCPKGVYEMYVTNIKVD